MQANGQRSGGAWVTGEGGMLRLMADGALEAIPKHIFGGDAYV